MAALGLASILLIFALPALAKNEIGGVEEIREERKVFLELLSAPDDPVLNLEYARLAMKKGQLDRAMEAYRRVLAVDPSNAEALAAIAEIEKRKKEEEVARAKTDFTLTLGGQYENNAPHRDPSFLRFDDTTAKFGFGVRDKRLLSGHSVESSVNFFKSIHNRWRAGDLLYVGIDSGPVLNVSGGTLRIAPTFKYAKISTRNLFFSYGLGLRYRLDTERVFKGFDVNASYDDYQEEVVAYTGPRFSAKLKYLLKGLWNDVDSFSVDPAYNHVHGVGGDGANRYDALSVSLRYRRPVFSNVVLTGAFSVEGRWYGGRDVAEQSFSHRKDFKIKPEVRLNFLDLLPKGGGLVARVNYEANISNDQDKKFRGYLIGATAKWEF